MDKKTDVAVIERWSIAAIGLARTYADAMAKINGWQRENETKWSKYVYQLKNSLSKAVISGELRVKKGITGLYLEPGLDAYNDGVIDLQDFCNWARKAGLDGVPENALKVAAALGLPLSALHLGRPLKALSAMKNLRTSWLSREAAALGAFAGLMSANVALYFFDIHTSIRLGFELLTMLVGIYGIHAQAMIYRIPARPSWDRTSTNQKFFTTAYSGLFLISLALILLGSSDSATVLLSSAMIVAVIHGFFTFGAYNELKFSPAPQLQKTLRLYRERFNTMHILRWITFGVGALALPLLATLFIASHLTLEAITALGIGFLLLVSSELMDRFLFYTTTIPLQMAGGFFVGPQRN